jgi:2-isopropylmalate synthase
VNGIGERAGNASLEEVVMALHTRGDHFGGRTGIVTQELTRASRLVSACTGTYVAPNKAIVGANAFAHEAGIHQDGVIKERTTYEIMSPQDVGWESSRLVLGKHSGRHGVAFRLAQLGIELDEDAIEAVYARFIEIADAEKEVTDRMLLGLVSGAAGRPAPQQAAAYAGGFPS